jgi:ethanolamine utilization protein EutN
MRIGMVVGKVSLLRVHPSLVGKRYVLVHPQSLKALAGGEQPRPEEVVVVDELGCTPGARIGFSEGAEASAPFNPEKKPVDAYVGAIIEQITLDRTLANELMEGQ